MYEFKMGGLWFRWGALDRRGKWLAGLSIVASGLAGALLGVPLGLEIAGGQSASLHWLSSFTPFMAWGAVGLGVTSAVLWWRFSREQDEMFNRVQNWALGYASSWTMMVVTIWTILAFAGAAPPVSMGTILPLYLVALTVCWFVAVRRWA